MSTARLKEQYRPGYKKALDELFEVIRKALREAVSERMAVGSAGPDLLARKFPIGPRQGGGKPKQAFHFRGLRGELTPSGAWRFSGELRAVARGSRGWEATVDLRFGGESSGGQGGGLIREFSIDAGRGQKATCVVENGRALVRLPPTADHLRFEGESDVCKHPVDAHLSVAELIVEGRLSEEGR